MRAPELFDLIAAKHSKDVVVGECKVGSSPSIRIDAWAMLRSWVNPWTYVYEIKVSRADFLADNKMHFYLPYANYAYVVCVKGICEPDELPAGFGLLVASKNLRRLHTVRKAPHREVEIPEEFWRYVAMTRVAPCYVRRPHHIDRKEQWEGWLELTKEKKSLGHMVGGRIGEIVGAVESENAELKRQNGALGKLKELADKLGVDLGYVYNMRESVQRALKDINGDGIRSKIDALRQSLEEIKGSLMVEEEPENESADSPATVR